MLIPPFGPSPMVYTTGINGVGNSHDRRGDAPRQQGVEESSSGQGYFFAFLSARFSFMVLAGFFLVSFFES
jgi:hypothetical protein